jgi:hypothetical protein
MNSDCIVVGASFAGLADFLHGRCDDPAGWFAASYPRFRAKRLLRFLFDAFQSDILLRTRALRAAAGMVYFHHKGVFDPGVPAAAPNAATSAVERMSDAP